MVGWVSMLGFHPSGRGGGGALVSIVSIARLDDG